MSVLDDARLLTTLAPNKADRRAAGARAGGALAPRVCGRLGASVTNVTPARAGVDARRERREGASRARGAEKNT